MCAFLHMCVCIYMSVCVHACMCVCFHTCTCGGEGDFRRLSPSFSILVFGSGSLSKPRIYQFSWISWPFKPQVPSCFCLSKSGIQVCPAKPGSFYVGTRIRLKQALYWLNHFSVSLLPKGYAAFLFCSETGSLNSLVLNRLAR